MELIRLFLLLGVAVGPVVLAWAAGQEVREPIIAGSWYEGSREGLAKQIDGFLAKVPKQEAPGRVIALISPHAGLVYSGQTAAYGYALLKGQPIKRIILLGPSHRAMLKGASIPVAKSFLTPLGSVPLDRAACDKLVASGAFKADPSNQSAEHSLEIQLPFLQRVSGGFSLVPIMVGFLGGGEAEGLAKALQPFVDETTVLVASSDFTHYGESYGYVPFTKSVPENLKKLDGGAVEQILKPDADGFVKYMEQTGATICGGAPIEVLLRTLPAGAVGRQLRYDRSGDMTGDYSMSVSYVSIGFFVAPGDRQ